MGIIYCSIPRDIITSIEGDLKSPGNISVFDLDTIF